MQTTFSTILSEKTDQYLSQLPQPSGMRPDVIVDELMNEILNRIELENAGISKRERQISYPKITPNYAVAQIMLHEEYIVRLNLGDYGSGASYVLAVYAEQGENEGIYVSDPIFIAKKIRKYKVEVDKKDINEILAILEEYAPKMEQCREQDYIAVKNGVFNYKTKQLMEFSPDVVLTSKSDVEYHPNVPNPLITNPDDGSTWDVESWMQSLSDDPEIVNLLWQLLGAAIRPNVRWNKSVFLYSESGNNGKGTLCSLIRNLCGEARCASISFTNFAKEFMLEPLIRSLAVIVDENPTNAKVKDSSNLKAAITGDVLQVNRKYKSVINYRFLGMIIQCINALPQFEDTSDSFYRRLLIIPFEKCFTGQERKYIKDDYLKRKDVLEYVLFRVLNMPEYYEFSLASACEKLLAHYKGYNDPVREFLEEMLPQLVWDLVPYAFLYDLYNKWSKRNCPSVSPQTKNIFISNVKQILRNNADWFASDTSIPPRHLMDSSEPLIADYWLTVWMNPSYRGNDTDKMCHPALKSSYLGLRRR